MIRAAVLIATLLLSGCQTQRDAPPPAPAIVAVKPAQQVAITNAIAKELADEHSQARGPGRAAAVESLKDAGRLAETRDGYLLPLNAAPTPQVEAIAAQVNDDRRLVYRRLATEQALDLAVVEAIAGDARTSGERPGRLVLSRDGQPIRR